MTFSALLKISSTKYFCNTKVAGLGKIFVQRKLLPIYSSTVESLNIHIHVLLASHVCKPFRNSFFFIDLWSVES